MLRTTTELDPKGGGEEGRKSSSGEKQESFIFKLDNDEGNREMEFAERINIPRDAFPLQ